MNVTKKIIFVSAIGLALTSCQNGGNSPSPAAAPAKDYMAIALAIAPTVTYIIPTDLNGDCSFNGTIIKNGTSTTAFLTSSVANGQTCTSEVRTCSNGVLSGTYTYSSCEVASPVSCLFNGQTVPSGSSITAYQNSSVGSGDECVSEVRACDNGTLSGSYQYENCSVQAPMSCLFDGQTIPDGQSVAAFLSSSVAYGSDCVMEYRTCSNGQLSGSNQFASCSVDAPASCLFNGQTVPSGATVTAFVTSSVAFGSSCSSEVRTCDNGVLSGSNQYASCNVDAPASCLFNGQTIAHGQMVAAYQSSSVDYGQNCAAETRVCDNGHLSGSFEFGSCDAGQPAACLFNGQTVPHGATVTAFASSSVTSPSSCSSEVRTCDNGTLSGSNQYASCVQNEPASCLFNGQTISSGQSVVAYQNATENGGVKCQAETRVCTDGVLSGSYANSSCSNVDYDDDNDDDEEMRKICKLVVMIKHKEHYEHNPASMGLHLGWLKYKERFNCGKHKGWYKHKNKDSHPTCHDSNKWYHNKDEKKK